MKESVSSLKEFFLHNIGFPTFQLPARSLNLILVLKTDLLNIIFDDFGI